MEIRQAASSQEKDDAFHVRRVVFVEEQNVPEDLEIDEHDETAVHLVGYDQNEPIAAARLRFVGEYGKLERICVKQDYRGRKYGRDMILFMESLIKDHTYQASKLNAQTHAESFYEALGYQTVSEEFMDAGIPHVTMTKTLD